MKKSDSYSAVILAAGNSSRMNFSKAFLSFDPETTFIEHIIHTYIAAGINDIILVVNEKNEKDIRLLLTGTYSMHPISRVLNRNPERGRFYSVQCGLKNVKNNFSFIQNVDCPFINKELLEQMAERSEANTYVVPDFRGRRGHPVIISNEIRKHLLSLPGTDHNLRNELKRFKGTCLPWKDSGILANINTPDEYAKYFLSEELLTS
jgi:molybdenum cofactor cytidylyltransferase